MRPDNSIVLTVDTALLSAVSTESLSVPGSAALLTVLGEPLIALQMKQLIAAGIRRFLVEVDVVSGAIVAVADRMKQHGVTVEFIRSPKELQDRLAPGELLFVMSGGIVAERELLAEMTARPAAYIVTVDGRHENDCFERIDLNSFWAGLALLDRGTVSAMASLPEEWNIGSSLLRQSLQDSVVHRPLGQELLTRKQLRRIITPSDAAELNDQLLARRAHGAAGMIERQLFGPMAARLAPIFWNAQSARKILDSALLLLAAGIITLAWTGATTAALSAALPSIFLIGLRNLLQLDEQRRSFFVAGIWALLAAAVLTTGWIAGGRAFEGLFASAVLLALLLYSSKAALSSMQRAILASPALLAILLLIVNLSGEWPLGTALLVTAQLAGLLSPLYFPFNRKQP